MLPSFHLLKKQLQGMLQGQTACGGDTAGFQDEFERLPDSYDALAAFAEKLARVPQRADWPYVEPNELDDIWAECDPQRPLGCIGALPAAEARKRAAAGFEASVAGCILGKPLEVNPTLAEIRSAAETTGEWPLQDYISTALVQQLGRRHGCWKETVRERIQYVAPDDDINYTILGMLLLETKGIDFTALDVMNRWLENLPPRWTWGPERTQLIKAAMRSIACTPNESIESWAEEWNPGAELCGAAIRVDAFGFACPGRPALAAELAWRDSHWTHRRTGIYASMFVAAAIAAAYVEKDRPAIFETALKFVPRRTRFYEIMTQCRAFVREARDWLDGYERIHAKYGQYGHCMLYQELGTVMNSVCFAKDVNEVIGMQVSQGCDTDCFGKIAGSILGVHLGPSRLDPHWLKPFNNRIHCSLANFHEQSFSAVTERISRLPQLVNECLSARKCAESAE
jgi:ADP-ribosylglycohydrolase